ncbi:hypothetical protein BDV26DRAFT_291176 [Aspergillus bertholletiae]|uniref:Uncharacterized protein n=1 Tax=Aspergillus bertholletiae TaxID=1226010 RepID=A0A5N7BCT2_9EURO|nr:hypothetical protein BDV26DRAFT_291176 [Aspergillus bertholletiae]
MDVKKFNLFIQQGADRVSYLRLSCSEFLLSGSPKTQARFLNSSGMKSPQNKALVIQSQHPELYLRPPTCGRAGSDIDTVIGNRDILEEFYWAVDMLVSTLEYDIAVLPSIPFYATQTAAFLDHRVAVRLCQQTMAPSNIRMKKLQTAKTYRRSFPV